MNKEDIKRWLKASLVALVIFTSLSLYLYVRRGFYDMYIINKVLGSTAVVLAGLALLIGPLRRISLISSLMTIRRHLGFLAFTFALLHIISSLSQTNRFAWFSWYVNEWIPVSFGIIAITTWGYMTYISRNKKIQEMGPDLWKKGLRFAGYVSFLAIFLHLTIMKYPGWIRWFSGQTKQTPELLHPSFPPASLFIFFFMVIVILYRLFIYLRKK